MDKNKRIGLLESPEIVSSEKILIHYSGKFNPWNVKGILDKRSSYYQSIYRELFQEKYHLSYNYKKNALIDLFNGFRNKRILDLDFPFTFIYLVIKSLSSLITTVVSGRVFSLGALGIISRSASI